jgi:hypothetical protein
MAVRFVRVKNKSTGHEYDVPEQQYDPEKHKKVDERRYPPTTRQRRPKAHVSKGGGSARRPASPASPVDTEE